MELKPSQCPSCGTILDDSVNVTGTAGPRIGDISICLYCSATMVYVEVDPKTFRLITAEELVTFSPHEQRLLKTIKDAVTETRKSMKRGYN